MKTDELIRTLAADNATRRPPVNRYLAVALLLGLAVALSVFFAAIGPRPDIASAAADPRFLFKFVVTIALAATAGAILLRVAQPGIETRHWLLALALAPVLLALGVLAELATLDPALREARLVGRNWAYCLSYVPLLSLPFLAAALFTLRHGAPTRPTLAGAIAGLLAGGLGATLYAAHCVDDSPLFVATWYSIAIAAVTVAGAAAGNRLLRW